MSYSEAERLQEVRATGILDSEEDPRYDDVATMVARVFGVDKVTIGFVDEGRVFYKSRIGFDVREAPSEGSLCRAVVDEGMVVADAAQDARFRDSSWVHAHAIKFCAGHAIRGPAGARIGALCIYGSAVRSLGDAEARQLRMLAGMVEDLVRADVGEARGSDALLRALIDSIDTEVALLDASGRITAVNRSWRRFSDENGGAEGQYEGTNYLDSFNGATDRATRMIFQRLRGVLRGDYADLEIEYPCPGPSGPRWFLMRAHRIDWDGPPRFVVLHDDITDRREAEEARQQRVQAKMQNRENSRTAQFSRRVLDTLAHELHTPLTPMRLRLHTLSMMELPERAERSVDSLLHDLDRIEALSTRILDAVRLTSPDSPVEPEPSTTNTLARLVRRTAKEMGLEDRVACPDELPEATVPMDQQWIGRVLEQFLGNAARFSPPDSPITVHIRRQRNRLRLEVQDQGIGLDPGESTRLFRLFGQAHDPHEDARVGPALGLYVAARIIEAHKGHIGLDSPGRGKGATAWFEIPMARKAQAPLVADAALDQLA